VTPFFFPFTHIKSLKIELNRPPSLPISLPLISAKVSKFSSSTTREKEDECFARWCFPAEAADEQQKRKKKNTQKTIIIGGNDARLFGSYLFLFIVLVALLLLLSLMTS
jgi:hypothetical protein